MDPRPRRGRIQGDMLVGLSAVVIGIAALAVSLYEARLMRAEQRASVLPIVEVGKSSGRTVDDAGELSYRFQFGVQNVGIGPARIRDVIVTIDGDPVESWGDVIIAVVGEERAQNLSYTQSTLAGRTLPPGDQLVIFDPGLGLAAERLSAEIDRFDMAVCYCSVFEECWQISYTEFGEPEPVRECRPGADTFTQ